MSTKYKTQRGLVAAIRKIEATPPAFPLKGKGYKRHAVVAAIAETLAAITGKSLNPRDPNAAQHAAVLYARRSTKARYNPMQFGGDQYVISPEMAAVIEKNSTMFMLLTQSFYIHRSWMEATR